MEQRYVFIFRVTKKVIGEKKKAKNTKQKKKRYTRPRRVVTIDPGRVNLIMAYDTSNGKYHRLIRNYYYRACGMKRLVKKLNERNLKRKGIYDAMSRSPTKSIREEDWYAYQLVITRNYDTMWRGKMRRNDAGEKTSR
jgi:hypothetical protein